MSVVAASAAGVASSARTPLVVLLMVGDEVCEHGRPEERDDVHDTESKRGFQHGAHLVWVAGERVALLLAIVSKRAQAEEELAAREVAAVLLGDVTEQIDACDQGAEEAEVDEGDEDG